MKIVVCKNPEQLGLQAQAWPWMGPFPDEGSASLLDKEYGKALPTDSLKYKSTIEKRLAKVIYY